MVNFGPVETVPAEFQDRLLYEHNPTVTLMRTTAEESAELGRRIGRKLVVCDRTGDALHPASRRVARSTSRDRPSTTRRPTRALFDGLRDTLGPGVNVRELDTDVNDPAFAHAMVDTCCHEHYQAWTVGEAARMKREEALARLRAQAQGGRPIIGAGAGTGLSAKCAEAGGADLIIVYNSGRYPHGGPRIPRRPPALRRRECDRHGDGGRGAPGRASTPVLAGVCGTDPVPAHARSSSGRCRRLASRASRTSRPSASSTASSVRTSRRRAWATRSRWR